MKKIYLFCLAVCLVVLSSCDSNSGAVKDAAKQFVKALNSADNATCCEQYPALRNADGVNLVSHIADEGVSVKAIVADSLYEVDLGNETTLVYRITPNGCEIADSHNVLEFPESYNTLAAKTGMPIKKLSDQRIYKMLCDDGEFINYLKGVDWNAQNAHLSASNGRYNWWYNLTNYTCNMTNNVTNNGSNRVSGSDYEVEFVISSRSGGNEIQRVTAYGRDIEPGSTVTIENDIRQLYSLAKNKDLCWVTNFKFKKSQAYMFAKYANLSGDEYAKFSGSTTEQ